MDRKGAAKKSSSKPIGGKPSSATASSKGRGRGGGKPSHNDDVDPKDPIVDKKFFDGGCKQCVLYYLMIFSSSMLTMYFYFINHSLGFVDDFDLSDMS
eukprot:scaffold9359_cov208-Skeletonema_marinoi.AAC.3